MNTLKILVKSCILIKVKQINQTLTITYKVNFRHNVRDLGGHKNKKMNSWMIIIMYILEDDKIKIKGCIKRLIVTRRRVLSKLVQRLGELLEDKK